MTVQVERAASVPGRDRRLVRQSTPAGYRAGWRSEGFGRTRRRRGNSQTWPRLECRWRCGHGKRRRGTPSTGDLTQRAVARWDLSTSSSWCRKQGRCSLCRSSSSKDANKLPNLQFPAVSQATPEAKLSTTVTTPFTSDVPGIVGSSAVGCRLSPSHHRSKLGRVLIMNSPELVEVALKSSCKPPSTAAA